MWITHTGPATDIEGDVISQDPRVSCCFRWAPKALRSLGSKGSLERQLEPSSLRIQPGSSVISGTAVLMMTSSLVRQSALLIMGGGHPVMSRGGLRDWSARTLEP